jgi:hypothetical protein
MQMKRHALRPHLPDRETRRGDGGYNHQHHQAPKAPPVIGGRAL